MKLSVRAYVIGCCDIRLVIVMFGHYQLNNFKPFEIDLQEVNFFSDTYIEGWQIAQTAVHAAIRLSEQDLVICQFHLSAFVFLPMRIQLAGGLEYRIAT